MSLFKKRISFATAVVAGLLSVGIANANDCHPRVDPSKAQYIVGYGSLMETSSKRSTEPNAGINLPALVTGFERSWNTHGVYPTTYLGVTRSNSASIVAAVYRDFLDEDGELASDAREIDYCRAAVDPGSIRMLDGSTIPVSGEVWIYVTKPTSKAPPDAEHPIVQSYVDIFITGCIQLQSRVSEQNMYFVEQCIRTTGGWSEHWVNDRIYPRRPFHYQPNAFVIDKYLNRFLPQFVNSVSIE